MKFISFAILCCAALPASGALVWTGSGSALFTESNWELNGVTPPAGTVDPASPINAAVGTIEMGKSSGNYGPYGGANGHFDLGGNTLLLSGGGNLVSASTNGLRSNAGGGLKSTVVMSGTSSINVQFILDLSVIMEGENLLQLRGGGAPINASTISIINPASSIVWTNETPTNVINEHLGTLNFRGRKIEFGSDPAIYEPGDNAILVSAGTNGSQMHFVPDSGHTLTLLGVACLGLLLRPRKQ